MCEEIGFEYGSLFPKIKSHKLKSMLEKSMKLCSMYVYYIVYVLKAKVFVLGDWNVYRLFIKALTVI